MLLLLFVGMNANKAEIIYDNTIKEPETTLPEIDISVKSGFYNEDIKLAMVTRTPGSIYYTKNGSEPDAKDADSTFLYQSPITLTADKEERVDIFKYKAVYEDGTESETYTNTYFMGENVKNRYDTLVISLTADYDNLYGHENGIFNEGKLREDWLAQHPDEEIVYDTPANYNVRGRVSERPVYIEMFEPTGERIISQNGGIRISGNFTRQSEQKSFKLYARSEYDEQNKFRYAFFEDLHSFSHGNILGKFKSLKIRNTGNDRSEGFIRDELGMTLAGQAGFFDTQSVRPVSVYINGAYQGLYWIHSTYDREYFEERYEEFSGEMVVIGNSETNMITDSEDLLENEYAKEYTEIYNKYSVMDLADDNLLEELNQYIDVENYLQYYAIEVYLSNRDWPFNNVKAYRYVSDSEYLEDTVFDGRYRYLLYDVDTTMGLGSVRESLDVSQSFDTLVMLEERNYAPLFSALMKREDCRRFFAEYICDLLNGAFSTDNVSAVLDQMHDLRKNEMQEYIKDSQTNPNIPEIGEPYLEMQMDCIKAWAEVTPDNMLSGIQQLWQLGDIYSLHVNMFEGDGVKINSLEVTEPEFTGKYLTGCNTILSPIIPAGEKFDYWEINGEMYMEEEITLDGGMVNDGVIYVTLYTDSYEEGLVLSEISAKGDGDYIILSNVSSDRVSTWGYYLMDKEKASRINYLEETMVEPGESILIGCKNYKKEDAFMTVNFNLKENKEVILGCSGAVEKETVTIPDLSLEDGIYKKNMITGRWQEEKGE